MIYLVSNGSELGTKGVWELNKHWLSLRASSTSKGEAQKGTALLRCPRAAQFPLQGCSAPQEHTPEPLWHWGKGQRKPRNCANSVICRAVEKPKCFWNDWVNISQFHAAPFPHSRCFYNWGGQAERGAEKSELCSNVQKCSSLSFTRQAFLSD